MFSVWKTIAIYLNNGPNNIMVARQIMEVDADTARMASELLSETVGGKAMEGERNNTRITSVIKLETVGR